jgi:hypothetical protein
VVLATPEALAPLALATGAVDEVLPAHGLGPISGAFAPEVAVNLHGRGPQSHELLRGLGPGRLVAFRSAEARYDEGPAWQAGEYEVARWCRMLAGHGMPADPRDLSLAAPATALPGRVVVHAGAAHARRRWPVERFAAVARALAGAGEQVVLTGSGGEAALAEQVRVAAGLPGTAVLAGRTGVMELAGIVAAARLVVCGDTGVAHLATAFGTPSVVLFGPVSPAEWGPPPDRPDHVALWPAHAGARQVGEGEPGHGGPVDADAPDPVLLATAVADVLTAAERLLAAQDARPSTVPGLSCTPAPR